MASFADSFHQAFDLLRHADAGLWRIVSFSLGISGAAALIGSALGLPLGAWLAVRAFPGRGALLVLLHTLLALPSVVVGLIVYLLLSRSGPLGSLGLLFSPGAMVLAQTILVLPIVTALVRQIVEAREHEHGDQLASLGAAPLQRALLLAWDERLAVLTVLLTAFGRAIAEVGAVMIVGGNIEGYTRVMTTAIALETSKGDLALALGLGLVLLAVVGLLHALAALVGQGRTRWLQALQRGAHG